METKRVRYPLGLQFFPTLRKEGFLYIDKTEYVYNMTHSDSKYIFLSRPRRFGKSLLVSTLRAYFEGHKELFEGLAIEKLEKEWTVFPVINIDMSGGKHFDKGALERYISEEIKNNAQRLGVEVNAEDYNIAFSQLIQGAYNKYGEKVVVLLDEYDAPLLDVAHDDDNLKALRQAIRNFYSPIKKSSEFLHFVFITGVTKFSQLSIFSELNNIANISMLPEYAGICGITEEELLSHMEDGISCLAKELGLSKDEAFVQLKENYDGYHFSWQSPDVYNPFSLLNALSWKNIDAYWFGSGTPTFLIEMMRKFNVTPSEVGSATEAQKSEFDSPLENMQNIAPLLYQSGYTTIKGYDKIAQLYTLDIPNKEIKIGLMQSLLPNYLGKGMRSWSAGIGRMLGALRKDDMDCFLKHLQEYLGTIPQTDNTGYEGHWQQLLYVIFSLMGMGCDVEVRTPTGRVDLVVRTTRKLYLFELKLNKSAEAAMNQIDLKNYPQRFALCGLPIVKVALNFDLEKKNITEWNIEEQD